MSQPLPPARPPASTIVAVMLTWNDPARCRESLTALLTHAAAISTALVYDNGSEPPLSIADLPVDPRIQIVRSDRNLGAGGGQSAAFRAAFALTPTPDAILYVEDDFVCRRTLPIAALASYLTADPAIGRIALADRPVHPKSGYYTFTLSGPAADAAAAQVHLPLYDAPDIGRYQRLRLAWSNYPCLVPAAIAERYLVHNYSEARAGAAFYAGGHDTLSCQPGWFYQSRQNHRVLNRAGWSY